MNLDSGTKAPVLRFKDDEGKEYPEWEFRPFSEVYSFKPTKSLSRNQLIFDEDSSISYIHYGDIHTKFRAQFVFTDEIVPFVSSDVDIGNIPCDMYCQDGDLVIADASEDYFGIGKTIEIIDSGKGKIVAGLHTFLARPRLRLVYIGFAAQMMSCEYVRLQIKLIAQGTKVLGISTNRLKTIILPLPCIYEQQKISNFLSAVDTRIEQLEKKKALLEQYKKGLMQKLFSQEIRFKDDQGEEYPEWEESKLKSVFSERIEKGHSGEELLSVTILKGVGRAKDLNRRDTTPLDKSNYKKLMVGDIAYNSMRMWQGASGVSPYVGIVSPAYTVITSNSNQDSQFWGYCFKLPKVKHLFGRYSQGLTSDTWNLKFPALCQIELPFPIKEEQQKIGNILSSVDRKIGGLYT